jgi:rhodanese-related sulfurtransferase
MLLMRFRTMSERTADDELAAKTRASMHINSPTQQPAERMRPHRLPAIAGSVLSASKTGLGVVLLALVFLSPAGPSYGQAYPQSVSDLIASAKAGIRSIDMQAFKAGFDEKKLGLIVDVREPGEYAQGHVPGAINIPRGLIELKIWPYLGFPEKLDVHKRITLYCGSGTRAALAAKSLHDLGLSDVVAADMSIEAWSRAGYPLVRD